VPSSPVYLFYHYEYVLRRRVIFVIGSWLCGGLSVELWFLSVSLLSSVDHAFEPVRNGIVFDHLNRGFVLP